MEINDRSWKGKPGEVARGIYHIEVPTPFSVGPINLYLIEGEKLTLVDAGPLTSEAWDVLSRGLEQIGYKMKDIEQVILTHQHVDHGGLLERIRQASGAHTIAHPLAVPYVELNEDFMSYHDRFFYELYFECGVPKEYFSVIDEFHEQLMTFSERSQIDEVVKHKQTVPNLSEWQVIYTPGHTQCHIALYRKEDRVLIAGDHIIKHVSSNAFIEPPQNQGKQRPMTLLQYRTSLEMCVNMEIDTVFSAHGEPVTNHQELISQRLKKNWERADKLRGFLQDGEKTAFQLSMLLFPHLKSKVLPLTISETLGHLDLLTLQYQVGVTKRDGILYYSV